MMKVEPPLIVDVTSAARQAWAHEGCLVLAALPRLCDCVQAVAPQACASWQAAFSQRVGVDGALQDWLHLSASAEVGLVCQRCLAPVTVPLVLTREFRFVATEAQADREDDEATEDLLVRSRQFDLAALIEDELILALPLVALHPDCQPPAMPGAPVATEPVVNPFAALASLRRPG